VKGHHLHQIKQEKIKEEIKKENENRAGSRTMQHSPLPKAIKNPKKVGQ
jgi:hypothetical protein